MPEPLEPDPVRRNGREVDAPTYGTKALKFVQVGLLGRADVDGKLAPFVVDGKEVVIDDGKR